MKPMLARTYGPKYAQYPCFVQPKLNGVRALSQTRDGVFQSRDEKLWRPDFVAHLRDEMEQLYRLFGDVILDGEFYVHGWRLQRIAAAMAVNATQRGPDEDTMQVEYHIFDRVDPTQKFSDRWLDIYTPLLQANLQFVKAVPTALIHSTCDADLHFHQHTNKGYEGTMYRPDGPYEYGEHLSERTGGMTEFRSRNLWKRKQWEDGEFLCVGITNGEGKADIGIGALVLTTCYFYPGDDRTTEKEFKVGTGFDDAERIEFKNNPPTGKKIKVRYLELTADGIPFNPSFLCVID